MYKLSVLVDGEQQCVIRLSDNAIIPMDNENSDYIEYLKWIADGNSVIDPNAE